ncbi:hypothetical protein DVH24_025733, partial [Malus domestica]
ITEDGQEQNATEEKNRTRTSVKNIQNRDECKANVLPEFDYVPVQKKPKNKAKYIYAVSDSESPSIVISQQKQNLEPIFEKEKEERIVEEEEERPIAETEKHKPMVETQKKKPMVETEKKKKVHDKEKVKPIVDKTKEKPKVIKAKPIAKETKRKPAKKTNAKSSKTDKGNYFWMQPKKQNMAHELVVLKSDLTSLFIDGAID